MNLVNQLKDINNNPTEAEPTEPVPPRIKGLIITELNSSSATYAARKCGASIEKTQSEIDYTIFPATLPSTAPRDLKRISYLENPELLPWTWPTRKEENGIDFKTGLYKSFDPEANQPQLIADAVSHMRAWQYCIDVNQPIIVMNSDTEWMRRYVHDALTSENHMLKKGDVTPPSDKIFNGGLVSLKHPNYAFRGIGKYESAIANKGRGLSYIIPVDMAGTKKSNYPQHIIDAGTYLITPWAAKKLLEQIKDNGMWPIHILMNRQLFPWIQIILPFYTAGQNN